jgi:hypothetical protein
MTLEPPPYPTEEAPTQKQNEKDRLRYEANKRLGQAMGVYFYQLCKMRDSMGRDHLTTLLNAQRKERLDAIRERKTSHRKG